MSFIADEISGPDEFWASFWMYFLLSIAGWVFMLAILPVLLVLSLSWILARSLLCAFLSVAKIVSVHFMLLFHKICRRCEDVVDRPEPVFDDAVLTRGRQSSRHRRNQRPRVLSYDSAEIGRWNSDLSSLTVQTGARGRAAQNRCADTRNGGQAGAGALQPLLFGCQKILFYNYASVSPDTSTQTIYGGSEESSGDRAYLDAMEGFGSSSSLLSSDRMDDTNYWGSTEEPHLDV